MKKFLLIFALLGLFVGFAGARKVQAIACSSDCSTYDCGSSCGPTCSSSCNTQTGSCMSTGCLSCTSWHDWSSCSEQYNGDFCRSRLCASNSYDYEIDCNCCDCGGWSGGACGNGTNGCGWGNRNQSRSCDPGGCDDEHDCTADAACPFPVQVQGFKVMEPGSSAAGAQAGLAVSLSGGGFTASNPSGNPYSYNWNSTAGATRTASVPAIAGYDTGYSVCYESTACHGGPTTVNGRTMTLPDDSIRSNCGNNPTCYADLWWHYCPVLNSPPANVRVDNQSAANNVCLGGGSVTARWDAVPGAYHYEVIVADLTDGTSRPFTVVGGTTQTFTVTNNHNYRLSVRAQNTCRGPWTAYTSSLFQVVSAPAQPTNIAVRDDINRIYVSFQDASNNETDFAVTRNAAFSAPNPRLVATTTRAGTGTSYGYLDQAPGMTCGVAYQYCVSAYASDYPAGCSNSPVLCAAPFSCADYSHAWFQTQGGGISAGAGQLSMYMPPQPPIPPTPQPALPTPVWQMDGEPKAPIAPQGNPGVVYGSGLGGTVASVPATEINSKSWLSDISPGWGALPLGSGTLDKPENSFDIIRQRVVSRAVTRPVAGSSLDEAGLKSLIDTAVAANKIIGVTILEKSPIGDLTLDDADGNLDLGGRQVVIFVDGAVNLNSRLTSTGMVAIIARGNITVSSAVGQDPLPTFPYQANIANDHVLYPYHLTGVFYTESVFLTGAGSKQLKINGSVVGMGGVSLGRQSFGPYPAEFIHFNPKATKILRDVGLRRVVRQEIVAP